MKFLINFYEVEDDAWKCISSRVVEGEYYDEEIYRITSCGYRLTVPNIYVKTFTSEYDDKLYLAYVVNALPNL